MPTLILIVIIWSKQVPNMMMAKNGGIQKSQTTPHIGPQMRLSVNTLDKNNQSFLVSLVFYPVCKLHFTDGLLKFKFSLIVH